MSGEMCVLLPSCAGRFEKYNQLRRCSVVPRCLFGPPDPEDTERMFQEHMKYNREMMLHKYNVDILENGPQKGTQLLLVIMKHESKRLDELRDECDVKEVDRLAREAVERLPKEQESRLEDNFTPVSSGSALKSKTEKSTKRSHPYSPRQSQLTEFWRCRRHLTFDAAKSKPPSAASLAVPALSVPRFAEERSRN